MIGKWVAYFALKLDDADNRIAIGDEICLKYRGVLRKHWYLFILTLGKELEILLNYQMV